MKLATLDADITQVGFDLRTVKLAVALVDADGALEHNDARDERTLGASRGVPVALRQSPAPVRTLRPDLKCGTGWAAR